MFSKREFVESYFFNLKLRLGIAEEELPVMKKRLLEIVSDEMRGDEAAQEKIHDFFDDFLYAFINAVESFQPKNARRNGRKSKAIVGARRNGHKKIKKAEAILEEVTK